MEKESKTTMRFTSVNLGLLNLEDSAVHTFRN